MGCCNCFGCFDHWNDYCYYFCSYSICENEYYDDEDYDDDYWY